MRVEATEAREDDLLNFVGALVKEHASLRRDDQPAQPSLNRKPANRAEPHRSAQVQHHNDRT
jgi:hypothetical protein